MKLLENYDDIKKSLRVSVNVDFQEIEKIIVLDLIKKRSRSTSDIKKSFNDVIKYYTGDEEFKRILIEESK